MKRVVVVGCRGQDGAILVEQRARDHAVVGLDVGSVQTHRLQDVALPSHVDVADAAQVAEVLAAVAPAELYYLAARHHSSEEQPDEATELRECTSVHLLGLVNALDALRLHAPTCRVFYAGSSQMFGRASLARQDEATPFAPRNPYAITKVAGANACALFRERFGMHVSVGILYNHESPRRGSRFVSQRIVQGAVRASRDPNYKLTLGSLSAVVDWGYVPDFVDAMIRIVSQSAPDDYIIATGEPHTVQDFVEVAFSHLGLDWRTHVEERVATVEPPAAELVGDATKLRTRTGWKPTLSFEQMVRLLVDASV
jgi:GDPmannose 4,6-dehydratase